jgi:hypothetical protein
MQLEMVQILCSNTEKFESTYLGVWWIFSELKGRQDFSGNLILVKGKRETGRVG